MRSPIQFLSLSRNCALSPGLSQGDNSLDTTIKYSVPSGVMDTLQGYISVSHAGERHFSLGIYYFIAGFPNRLKTFAVVLVCSRYCVLNKIALSCWSYQQMHAVLYKLPALLRQTPMRARGHSTCKHSNVRVTLSILISYIKLPYILGFLFSLWTFPHLLSLHYSAILL